MGVEAPTPVQVSGRGRRVGLVVARFNGEVTEALRMGAEKALTEAGMTSGDIQLYRVPGAFEIPVVVQRLMIRRDLDGVIALGAVIRGDTPHFDYVSKAVTDGCMRASLDHGCPVSFGVLTCDTQEQALARCGDDEHNKGREAALALLETVAVLAEF